MSYWLCLFIGIVICGANAESGHDEKGVPYSPPVVGEISDVFLSENRTYAGDKNEMKNLIDMKNIVNMLDYSKEDGSDLPENCDEALEGNKGSGVYKMYIPGPGIFYAYCSKQSAANWMIIQRRMNGLIDFYRDYDSYVNGFGDLNGEYWLGLELINALTNREKNEIWFEMKDHENNRRYARYNQFIIDDESTNYTLSALGEYTGSAGDSFRYQVGNQFTTKDADNDLKPDGNCAERTKGAWWFGNCRDSHFNGLYKNDDSTFPFGIHWYSWLGRDYSLKYVHMAIRPLEKKKKTPPKKTIMKFK